MSDIKTGLWQSTLDGSYIEVNRAGKIGVYYNDEGCDIEHVMSKKEFEHCYKFVGEGAPVIDDTFNDDTLAQTFGDVSNHLSSTPFEPIKVDRLSKKYITRVPNVWRRDEKEVEAAGKTIPFASCDFGTDDKTVTCDFFSLSDDKPMRLIGIAGPARAGKDTLASYLLDNLSNDWLRSSFADPLKEMLRAIGVDCSDGKKAVVSDDYGVTPRHMMQTLGTEWGRNLIDSDIWVKAFARMNAGKCVIVPDVRFENEAELVREHGVLIHLVGRGGIEGNHVSENAIAFMPGDIVIDNSRDLAWLHAQVDSNAVLGGFIAEVNE